MATLLPQAEQTFFDLDGEPLAGGYVFFYAPGTTTPKDTWSDPAGTILNQNPVVLDGAGRAIIYGTGSYRQVVKDALSNVIWDQVTADTASSAASWAGTAGGTANNVALTADNFASIDGQAIDFLAAFANTGPMQATINGTAIPLKLDTVSGPVQTPAGCTAPGCRYRLTYDAVLGLLHLTPVVDRGYVDAEDQSILAQAVANTAAQVSSGVSGAESFATGAAAQAQANAEAFALGAASQAQANATSAAESYAAQQAAAAQSAAISTSEAYAAQGDANTLSTAESYAAAQASGALQQAETYANTGDANTLAAANANAQGYANTAQSSAVQYAANAAASAKSQAESYSDGNLASAQSNNAATYPTAFRFSGSYSASGGGRLNGSVVVGTGGSSDTFKYVQALINNQWVTFGDA